MRHPKLIIAGIGVALAAAGGTTAAVVTSSAASTTPPAVTAPAAVPGTAATVRVAHVPVGGKTEAILTDGKGLPLYFYATDTAARSRYRRSRRRPTARVTLVSPTQSR